MQVLALGTKATGLVERVVVVAGRGLEGDRHAQLGSPRQVLLVGEQVLQDFQLPPGALGENLLLSGDLGEFASGQLWQVGPAVCLRLMFRCEPCRWLNRLQPDLARRIGPRRGWLASVMTGGEVRRGDRLARSPGQGPGLSDRPRERFAEFVARIPSGRVVRTPALLLALGVSPAYSRVLPSYLQRADPALPCHRLVRAEGRLFSRYLPHQADCLRAEGVRVAGDRVVDRTRDWEPAWFHALPMPAAGPGDPPDSLGRPWSP